MAFPTGWLSSHKITIDNTKVSGSSNLTDFPALLTEDNFKTDAFDNSDNGGGDIRFSSDAAGDTQLSCEIVTWNTSTNVAQVYVKVPTVSYNSDTVIYVWYNKTGETQPAIDAAFGAESVWSSGYKGVWHLEGTLDSTSNDSDLTGENSPTNQAAKIGNGYDFNNQTDNESFQSSGTALAITGDQTVEFWANFDAVTDNSQVVTKTDFTSDSGYGWNVDLGVGGVIRYRYRDGSANQSRFTGSAAPGTGVWAHYFMAADVSAQGFTMLANGTAIPGTIDQTAASAIGDNSQKFGLATQFSNGTAAGTVEGAKQLDGKLDEVRVYSGLLSSDWGVTSYNNQSSPSTFAKASSDFTRSMSSTVSLSDTLTRDANYDRRNSSTIGITDTLDRSVTIVKTLSDAMDITDSLTGGLVVLLQLEDNVGIADSSDLVMQLARSIEDSVGVTDTLVRTVSLNRSFADSVGITDTLDYTTLIDLVLSDAVGITDEIGYVLRTIGSPFIKLIIIDDEIDGPPKIKDIENTDPTVKMDSVE